MRATVGPVASITGLTTRMAKGEEMAFREFHEAYFARLFHYLLVVSGGREDAAKDALQSTFLRVVRHARRFDSEDAFWSWLTVLARSALADEDRKCRRYRSLVERFIAQLTPRPAIDSSRDTGEKHLVTLLEQNLAALPPGDRVLLENKYFDHQSVKAIAEASGSTEKAVESRLGRVRHHLKELILAQLKNENAV